VRSCDPPTATMYSQRLDLGLVVGLPDLDIVDTYLAVIPSPIAGVPVSWFRPHILWLQLSSAIFLTAAASFSAEDDPRRIAV
jgi:hypothetical protein